MTDIDTLVALRPDLDLTITGLRDEIGGYRENPYVDLDIDNIHLVLSDAEPHIMLRDTAVLANEQSMAALADALQVPTPFFKRLGKKGGINAQGELINMVLNHSDPGRVRAEYVEGGSLIEVRDPDTIPIRPFQILDVASKVVGEDALVQRVNSSSAVLSFDVHVPFDDTEHVWGDGEVVEAPTGISGYSWSSGAPIMEGSRVGDVTAGGLRFGLDMKRGLSPTVQPWAMRLACTNGMEYTTELTKIDARGMSVHDVLVDLELKAQEAFGRVERQIRHFYDLRNSAVPNPERRLRAIAREQGIPDRSLNRMLDLAPALLGDTTTEFDIANAVSNLANHASVHNDGGRQLLERSSGQMVVDHAVRCQSCNHRLAEG